MLYQNSY